MGITQRPEGIVRSPQGADRAMKRKHERRLDALDAARVKAQEDWLVGISEAYEDGLSQADISYILGNTHATSVGKYRRLGDEIREQRRGGGAGQSGERGADR